MKLSDEAVAALARAIGIDAQEIAKRKVFLEFGEADIQLLTDLHKRIHGAQQRFVDEFYAHLLEFDETRRFISDEQSLARLKRTQSAYFESLTAGDYGTAYILDRLRVGVVHQRIGLAPKWYIGAYSKYFSGLLHRNPQKFLDTYRAMQKIVLLDRGLAIDT